MAPFVEDEFSPSTAPGWRLVVDPASDGQRLDRFIASRIERLSRARAARLVVVDVTAPSTPLKKSAAVREGQVLWVSRPVPDAGQEVPTPEILRDDGDIVLLNKPAGLAVHPSASRFLTTVTHWLSTMPTLRDVKPAHRLDVETSGVLVCARPGSEFELGQLFAKRQVTKTYLAIVQGEPRPAEWTQETPLGFDESSAIRLKMGIGSLSAKTHFKVMRRSKGRALVAASPLTGRQHQIRVHLAMSGFPIVGDKLYHGGDDLFIASRDRPLTPDELAFLGHHRQALHAWRIEIPLQRGPLIAEAALSDDLTGLLEDDE